MKMKLNRWLNTKTGTVKYGIDVRHDGKWVHLAYGGKPMFFLKERCAKDYIKAHSS